MAKAARILDEAGWKPGSDGIRQKDGKRMELGLLYNSNSVTEKTIAESCSMNTASSASR